MRGAFRMDGSKDAGPSAVSSSAPCCAVHEGFCVELRELWSGDRLLTLNQQTFAVLK